MLQSIMQTETVPGHELITRLAELKAAGIFIFALETGRRNGDWIIEYYPKQEQPAEQPALL